jgi:hypothetical protein
MHLSEYTTPECRFFTYKGDAFNSDFAMYIHMASGDIPTIERTLKSLEVTSKITQKYSMSSIYITKPLGRRRLCPFARWWFLLGV